MEKSTPHCKLQVVKALVASGQVRSTFSALAGAAALGLDFDGIVAVVMALTTADFYKSRPPTQTIASGKTCTAPPHQRARSISNSPSLTTCSSCPSRSSDHEMPILRRGQAGA